MMLTSLPHTTALAAMIAVGMTAATAAQTTPADPHHPETMLIQAMPPSGMMGQRMGAQPAQSSMPAGQPAMMCGMMQPGMMDQGIMGRGMTGMPGATPMKVMFAIADANGDGGLSFGFAFVLGRKVNCQMANTPGERSMFMRDGPNGHSHEFGLAVHAGLVRRAMNGLPRSSTYGFEGQIEEMERT
jgi:hypothetical protein